MVIFNERLANVAERLNSKGSKIYIDGRLQIRNWTDQGGQERYSPESVVQRFRGDVGLLGDGNEGEGQGLEQSVQCLSAHRLQRSEEPRHTSNTNYTTRARSGGPQWEAPRGGDLDDEIPF